MKYRLTIVLVFCIFQNATSETHHCYSNIVTATNTQSYTCTELMYELHKYLSIAKTNTTDILIYDSKIPHISGFAFERFGATLRTLDLHESGIETCDSQAFVGLISLETLILWGNKIKKVHSQWFTDTRNLRVLDLSFNFIDSIEYGVFAQLPRVEKFYFDYNQLRDIDFNMFAYMTSLKKVKFGKNPWKWPYRARLTWQMESQYVDYTDQWEEWNWMNNVIKDCMEMEGIELPSEEILDCATRKLLDFAYDTFGTSPAPRYNQCIPETRKLVSCMKPVNVTRNVHDQTIRMILEDYSAQLYAIDRAESKFVIG